MAEIKAGRVPGFYETVEVWLVDNPESTVAGAVAVEVRIVGARGGVRAKALLSGWGAEKLADIVGKAGNEASK